MSSVLELELKNHFLGSPEKNETKDNKWKVKGEGSIGKICLALSRDKDNPNRTKPVASWNVRCVQSLLTL